MSSVAQIEANQTNAQFSTGPTTPEGKARSSANATKLGLYTKQAVLLTAEDHQEFATLTATYEYELGPRTPVERTLFAQLVLAAWNIQRANRLEAELAATEGIDPLLSENKAFHRIAAARSRAERTFHKSLQELRAAQSAPPQPKLILKNEPNSISHGNVPYLQPDAKIEHHQLCPCHSGRKSKNCCLRNKPNSQQSPSPITHSL